MAAVGVGAGELLLGHGGLHGEIHGDLVEAFEVGEGRVAREERRDRWRRVHQAIVDRGRLELVVF